MTPLAELIARRIGAEGPMDVATFMDLALGHPEHGYYMKKDPFGAEGDFTTAPEISQMFGEMVGAWVADMWMKLGSPDPFTLLECGPGRGTLMADILRVTKAVPGFHAACRVCLLEMSPALKKIQSENLKAHSVQWIVNLNESDFLGPVIVVGNEFFDALPVHQMIFYQNKWKERKITISQKRDFVFCDYDSGLDFFPHAAPEDGAVFEISPQRLGVFSRLCNLIRRGKGAGLFIDYGHAEPGFGDTLQAVYRHEFCGVFDHIGDADLTTHVDFAALAEQGRRDGVKIHGPVTQGGFLNNLGIEVRAQHLQQASPTHAQSVADALHRLTGADQMGTLFKVMGVSYGLEHDPEGF